MKEVWKDIPGFDGFYQVSNLGRVRSTGGWCGTAKRKPLIRSISLTKDGYEKVRLIYKEIDVTRRIHRLVAELFVPNPDGKPTVNHIDGNKRNNNASNLEWADRHEQLYHAYAHGLKKPIGGPESKNAKLTADQVREIRQTYVRQSKEFGTVALSKKYGVTNRVIGLVVRGLTYKEIK